MYLPCPGFSSVPQAFIPTSLPTACLSEGISNTTCASLTPWAPSTHLYSPLLFILVNDTTTSDQVRNLKAMPETSLFYPISNPSPNAPNIESFYFSLSSLPPNWSIISHLDCIVSLLKCLLCVSSCSLLSHCQMWFLCCCCFVLFVLAILLSLFYQNISLASQRPKFHVVCSSFVIPSFNSPACRTLSSHRSLHSLFSLFGL